MSHPCCQLPTVSDSQSSDYRWPPTLSPNPRIASVTRLTFSAVPFRVHNPLTLTPNTEQQRDNTLRGDCYSFSLQSASAGCFATGRGGQQVEIAQTGLMRRLPCRRATARNRRHDCVPFIVGGGGLQRPRASYNFRTWDCRNYDDNFSMCCTISHHRPNTRNDERYPRSSLRWRPLRFLNPSRSRPQPLSGMEVFIV